jgi:hypothetical protein
VRAVLALDVAEHRPGDGEPGVLEGFVSAPAEQPMPVPNAQADIQSLVIADVVKRRTVGIERYGTPLQPFNGRDALRDAYEEALDLACYLRQVIEERHQQEQSRVNTAAVSAVLDRIPPGCTCAWAWGNDGTFRVVRNWSNPACPVDHSA